MCQALKPGEYQSGQITDLVLPFTELTVFMGKTDMNQKEYHGVCYVDQAHGAVTAFNRTDLREGACQARKIRVFI